MKIVCLTSNLYHPVLEPFTYYWNTLAGDERRVTVACYDAPVPALPDNFDVLRIGAQTDYTWSSGLLRALNELDADVILLTLEDYFLIERPNWPLIDECADLLARGDDVVKVDLSDDRLKHDYRIDRTLPHGRLIRNADAAPFQTSLQAALWRTNFLRRFLEPTENPWEFEKRGTKRIIAERQAVTFRGLVLGCKTPPLVYSNACGGAGSKPGLIQAKHMPAWMWAECIERGWAA